MDLIAAVANLVRDQNLEVEVPVNLRSTNNVVAWMCPSPVVAKIARRADASARELTFARFLAENGAPAVPPIEIGIPQPVSMEGRWVTFWRYVAAERSATPAQVATSLCALHTGLAKIPDRPALPPCRNRLKTAIDLLDSPELPSGLSGHDHSLLRRALLDGITALILPSDSPHVLHGSPHRNNILVTGGEALFIDFETVEVGPLEWDLAHLEKEVADLYPIVLDEELLQTCRIAISAATSVWCWQGIDRGADMRSHAGHHLEAVRRALD